MLAHLAPVLGAAPSGPTVRRDAGPGRGQADAGQASPARGRRAGRRVGADLRRHPAGFPWLAIAGKMLTGWLVIDMDATLVTARSEKEGAAPTWKNGLWPVN